MKVKKIPLAIAVLSSIFLLTACNTDDLKKNETTPEAEVTKEVSNEKANKDTGKKVKSEDISADTVLEYASDSLLKALDTKTVYLETGSKILDINYYYEVNKKKDEVKFSFEDNGETIEGFIKDKDFSFDYGGATFTFDMDEVVDLEYISMYEEVQSAFDTLDELADAFKPENMSPLLKPELEEDKAYYNVLFTDEDGNSYTVSVDKETKEFVVLNITYDESITTTTDGFLILGVK